LHENVAEVIIAGHGDLSNVAISPDGRWFLYVESQGTGDVTGGSPDTFWLTRRAVTGGTPQRMFRQTAADDFWCSSNPKASSSCVVGQLEGKNIVFYSLDPVRGKGKQLGTIEVVSPYWLRGWQVSPDGSQVALVDAHKYEGTIKLLKLADGSWRDLSLGPGAGQLYSIGWTADGKGFIVTSLQPDSFSVLYVTLTGKVRVLLPHLSRQNQVLKHPQASSDGRHVAFEATTWDSNIWMIEGF
jgi:hypothetical protein